MGARWREASQRLKCSQPLWVLWTCSPLEYRHACAARYATLPTHCCHYPHHTELKDKFVRLPLHSGLVEQLAAAIQSPGFVARQGVEAGLLDEADEMAALEVSLRWRGRVGGACCCRAVKGEGGSLLPLLPACLCPPPYPLPFAAAAPLSPPRTPPPCTSHPPPQDLVFTGESLVPVLRLLVLYCAVHGGVPKRHYDNLR